MNAQEDVVEGVLVDESKAVKNASTRMRKWVQSLRTKLIVPYVLLTLGTAFVGLFVVTRLVSSTVKERFLNQLLEASRVASDGLVRREREHLAQLRLIAFSQGVSEAYRARDDEILMDTFWPLMLNESIDAASAVAVDGKEIITLVLDPESGQYFIVPKGDLSQLPLVSRILAENEDDLGDKYAGFVQTSFGTFLFSSAPVVDESDELVGVLLVGSQLGNLLEEIETQALAEIWVEDPSGLVLASTFVDSAFSGVPSAAEPIPWDEAPKTLVGEMRLYDHRYQGALSTLMVRNEPLAQLGVGLPSNYVVDTISTSRNVFSLIFSVGSVSIILLGYLIAGSISNPILRLRAVSRAVAGGDLEQETGIQSEDEIGDLAKAFDVMTDRLKNRTQEAAKLYEETALRNVELAEINEQLRDAQQQLVQSEKLAAIGKLTAGIVHDVKNPLATIKGLAEELIEDDHMSPGTQELLRSVRDNASRANTIVSDLLTFARQSTTIKEDRDLRHSIEAVVRLTEYSMRKAGIKLVVDMPPSPVMATYDVQQMEQVLVNLFQNAVEAMEDGGEVHIHLASAYGTATIAVRDEGIGIPIENMTRIFDPFFTTKPATVGTGLGLSVSYGIVAKHGGEIKVQSGPDGGSTFTVLLPLGSAAQGEDKTAVAKTKLSGNKSGKSKKTRQTKSRSSRKRKVSLKKK